MSDGSRKRQRLPEHFDAASSSSSLQHPSVETILSKCSSWSTANPSSRFSQFLMKDFEHIFVYLRSEVANKNIDQTIANLVASLKHFNETLPPINRIDFDQFLSEQDIAITSTPNSPAIGTAHPSQVLGSPSTSTAVPSRCPLKSADIFDACIRGDVTRTTAILQQFPESLWEVDEDGKSPLHEAVICEALEIVELLLSSGANPNAVDKVGCTPLHYATTTDNTPCAGLLVRFGASPAIKDNDGWTPFDRATTTRNANLILAVVNPMTNQQECQEANILREDDANSLGKLVKHSPELLTATNEAGWTLLHQACAAGSSRCVDVLLKLGADINSVADGGETPLHAAAGSGHTSIVLTLKGAGANSLVRDRAGGTPVTWASKNGFIHTAIALCETEGLSFLGYGC